MIWPKRGEERGAAQREAMRGKGVLVRSRVYSGSLLDAIRGAATVEDVEAYLQLGTRPQEVPEGAAVKPAEMTPSAGTVRKWVRAAEERIKYLREAAGAQAEERQADPGRAQG